MCELIEISASYELVLHGSTFFTCLFLEISCSLIKKIEFQLKFVRFHKEQSRDS